MPPICERAADSAYHLTCFLYDSRLDRHYHIWNDAFLERPERVTEPYAVCQKYRLVERCKEIKCREATESELTMLHSSEHVEKLRQTRKMTEEELKKISEQYDFIYFHPHTFENASLALGGTLDLVDRVLKQEVQNGMAVIRPPGHHAMFNSYCGYCYLNNVAIAAQMALDKYGMKRILIVDWDVHHGQGTQYLFYDDPRVLYFSIHTYDYGLEWPYLRGSDYDYIGTGKGLGYNINVPLNKSGCGNSDYMAIFQQILLPVAYEFCPELVLVSAGYDAAIGCPEGQMEVTPAMYSHFVNLLSPLAEGKICLIQEGGYCIKSLSEGIALSLKSLLGDPCPLVEQLIAPCESVKESILNVIKVLRPYWKSLSYQDDLTEGQEPEVTAVLEWPPRPDVKFYTDNMPESYSLFHDCYDPVYEQKKEGLMKQIDLLIKNTKLTFAPNKLCIVFDERVLQHQDKTSGGFEETPERASYCYEKLKASGLWSRCQEIKGREATTDELLLAHSIEYVNKMKRLSGHSDEAVAKFQSTFKSVYLCQDTYLSASVAVGCALNVVDHVMKGKAQAGVALVRPPGHHAEKSNTMGFCIFNTVGIAAKYAQKTYDLKRILIVDWDIHHGNGLQRLFYDDPGVLYMSVHRCDNGYYYPYGGDAFNNRVGVGPGEGFNVNLAWNGEPKGDEDYVAAFQQVVMPIAYQYGPELILVAAGFDAGSGDPMGRYNVSPACFAHLTHMLKSLANGNVILSLEGGYNLDTTADCLSMCVSDLLGDPCPSLSSLKPSQSAVRDIKKCLDTQKQYWSCLQYRVKLPTEEHLKEIKDSKEKQMKE